METLSLLHTAAGIAINSHSK